MKPTRIAVKYFVSEIIKRTSKAFSKGEITREDFDDVMNCVDRINVVISKIEQKGEIEDAKRESNQASQ